MKIIAQLVGAVAITFFLTRLVGWTVRRFNHTRWAAVVTFAISTVLVMIGAWATVGVNKGLMYLAPGLVLWLVVDLIRDPRKNPQIKDSYND